MPLKFKKSRDHNSYIVIYTTQYKPLGEEDISSEWLNENSMKYGASTKKHETSL